MAEAAGQGEEPSWEWERQVLPIFYYNDLLARHVGDVIGLNFFEPRYIEMCRRMTNDPRFLFMPNFEDYQCRVGDVGFIIRLQQMQPTRSGGYSIRGFAEELVAVSLSWVEPGTNGLHFGRCWSLDERLETISMQECQALWASMRARGWSNNINSTTDAMCRFHCELEGADASMQLGLNWQDGVFLLSHSSQATQLLQEAWAAACVTMARPRLSAAQLAQTAVQQAPASLRGLRLADVQEELLELIRADRLRGSGSPNEKNEKAEEGVLLQEALRELRLARFSSRHAVEMPTVRLHLLSGARLLVHESFPWLPYEPNNQEEVVHVTNRTNVSFVAPLDCLWVTEESAAEATSLLAWRLNRVRLKIIERACSSGHGPLAAMEDDAIKLVYGFVAQRPKRVLPDAR